MSVSQSAPALRPVRDRVEEDVRLVGTEEMSLSDNPIGASYLYLLEPEIRFLEAAVEHLIPTDELGPGARDAGVVVYIDRHWPAPGARTAANIAAARGSRARPSRAFSRASRHRRSIASRSTRSTRTARPNSSGRSTSCERQAIAPARSSWRRTRSRCRRCRRSSFSICCGATPKRAISPIRYTAAIATRWAGSCSASPACPAANTVNWSPAMSRTAPSRSACSTSRPARRRPMRRAFQSTSC